MADSLPDKIRPIMADVFDIEGGAIADDAAMGIMEQWDSGNHVKLILALEEEFGVSFAVSEIEAMNSFENVVEGVEQKL
jgi:acyl carrier protein